MARNMRNREGRRRKEKKRKKGEEEKGGGEERNWKKGQNLNQKIQGDLVTIVRRYGLECCQ